MWMGFKSSKASTPLRLFQIASKKVQLFFVVADCPRREVSHLTVKNKFLNKPFH